MAVKSAKKKDGLKKEGKKTKMAVESPTKSKNIEKKIGLKKEKKKEKPKKVEETLTTVTPKKRKAEKETNPSIELSGKKKKKSKLEKIPDVTTEKDSGLEKLGLKQEGKKSKKKGGKKKKAVELPEEPMKVDEVAVDEKSISTSTSKIKKPKAKKIKNVKGSLTSQKKKKKVVDSIQSLSVTDIETTSGITSANIEQAIEGVRHLEEQRRISATEGKKNIFDDDGEEDPIFFQVSIVKVASLPKRARHIVRPVKLKVFLPNPTVNSNTDVILITQDGKSHKNLRDDHSENLHHYQYLLRKCGAARHISEVITFKQLKTEYKEYESKRNLANRCDVLLVDDSIMFRLPLFIGKHFFEKRKFPIGINLKTKNLLSEVKRCLTIETLYLPMTGPSGVMKIGRMDQTNTEIQQNVLAALEKMIRSFPGGWTNVQSIYLKTERSKAVPIYLRINNPNSVNPIKSKKLSAKPLVTGEVSASYGDIFTVYPDNEVEFRNTVSQKERDWEFRRAEKFALKKEASEEKGKAKELLKTSKAKKLKTEEPQKKDASNAAVTPGKKKQKTKPKDESQGDSDVEEEGSLLKMEKQYLKGLSAEQEANPNKKQESDDEDDWAEASDEDMDDDGDDDDQV